MRAVHIPSAGCDDLLVTVLGDGGNLGGRQDLDTESLGLATQTVSEVAAGDTVRKAREVVDLVGDSDRAAHCARLDDERGDSLARGIDRRGQSGDATTDNDERVEAMLGFGAKSEFGCQIGIAGFDQSAAIVEDENRNDELSVVDPLDLGPTGGVIVHVGELVGHTLLAQELLGPMAVGAPGGAVHLDRTSSGHHGVPSMG